MRPYEHGGDVYDNKGITLDFSVNLNPFGAPDEIKRILFERFDEFSRYPDRNCRELTEAISQYEGVPEEQILCGNGAADIIYRMCFGLKPKAVLVCAPTFSEYERAALVSGGKIMYHELEEKNGFAVTFRILYDISRDTEIVFICSPNNPTGRLVAPDMLLEIAETCEKNKAVLVVDECFLDFTAANSAKQLIGMFPGVVVLKAFTKSFAMAGLRLGYMITRDYYAMKMARESAQPWSVSAPAQAAGIAALSADIRFGDVRDFIARERQFLTDSLRGFGITVYDSDANFILMKSKKPLFGPLLGKGILIRSCADYKGLDENFTRVCVRAHDENETLIAAIKEVLNG